jgi:hypothetical protein
MRKIIFKCLFAAILASIFLKAQTAFAAGAPEIISARAISQVKISLAWRAPADGFAASEYRVFRDNSQVAAGTATEFIDEGLATSTEYAYRITAVNAGGTASSSSQEIIVSTFSKNALDETPPGIRSVSPKGFLPRGIKSIKLSLSTDEKASCRFAENPDVPFYQMSAMMMRDYGGKSHSAEISGLTFGRSYTYYIKCRDQFGNISPSDYISAIWISSGYPGGGFGSMLQKTKGSPVRNYLAAEATSTVIEPMLDSEAKIAAKLGNPGILKGLEKKLFEKILKEASSTAEMNLQSASFIVYGLPSLNNLSSGQRAAALSSYLNAFGRLPANQQQWKDALKTAHGLAPLETSVRTENEALKIFREIYKKEYGRTRPKYADKEAFYEIAYGLLPIKPDLAAEKAGAGKFIKIYKRNPSSTFDWNTVRALGYANVK